MKSTASMLAVLLGAAFLTGCGAQRPGDPAVAVTADHQLLPNRTGPGLIDAQTSPIPDVPMPVGFVQLGEESSSGYGPSSRIVDHHYQGRALVPDLVTFYEHRLWQHGWTQVGIETTSEDEARVTAVKGGEGLEITASTRHDILTMGVTIGPLHSIRLASPAGPRG